VFVGSPAMHTRGLRRRHASAGRLAQRRVRVVALVVVLASTAFAFDVLLGEKALSTGQIPNLDELLEERVHFGRANEVVLAETTYIVGGVGHSTGLVADLEVGVMVFAMSDERH